jgi:hypothetical protein
VQQPAAAADSEPKQLPHSSAMCSRLHQRSIIAVVDKCLEEDLAVFKATVQDIVDELEVCLSLSST